MTDTATLDGASSRVRRRNFGKNHAYYLTMDDGSEVKLDGVTTLIGGGLPKPALVNWAGNVTAEAAVDRRDELIQLPVSAHLKELKGARFADRDMAAARGNDVHALAERLAHGEQVDVPDELAGHVESAVRFLDDYRIRPLLTETTVYNAEHFYGGTLDGVATSEVVEHAGKVILWDWKTSRSGIYSEAALQLAAYQRAEFYLGDDGVDHPMSELGITDAWGVWIRADGYDVYELDTSPETFRFFLHVATVARRARALDESPLKGAPLARPAA